MKLILPLNYTILDDIPAAARVADWINSDSTSLSSNKKTMRKPIRSFNNVLKHTHALSPTTIMVHTSLTGLDHPAHRMISWAMACDTRYKETIRIRRLAVDIERGVYVNVRDHNGAIFETGAKVGKYQQCVTPVMYTKIGVDDEGNFPSTVAGKCFTIYRTFPKQQIGLGIQFLNYHDGGNESSPFRYEDFALSVFDLTQDHTYGNFRNSAWWDKKFGEFSIDLTTDEPLDAFDKMAIFQVPDKRPVTVKSRPPSLPLVIR